MVRPIALLLFLSLASHASAQGQMFQRLPIRVLTAPKATQIEIDRGKRDRVKVGDLVVLFPRSGAVQHGSVKDVFARSARIEMRNVKFLPKPGMKGEVLVPKKRLQPVTKKAKGRVKKVTKNPAGEKGDLPRKDPSAAGKKKHEWRNRDRNWKPGQRLLAGVRPQRPEDRMARVTGRMYSEAMLGHAGTQGTSNSFGRLGADIDYENPFGKGGEIELAGELDYRTEQNDQAGFDVLLHRAAYTLGDSRFSRTRVSVGRFLQRGMPEFQVLDGFEVSRRLDNLDRFGFSAGFLPTPDDDYRTFTDFQVGAWYRWIADESERLTATAGLQKTFHYGRQDRDLLIAKIDSLSIESWSYHASAWVDFYFGDDRLKKSSVEVTQLLASAHRRYEDGSSLDLSLRHQRIPEMRRKESLRVLEQDIDSTFYNHCTRLIVVKWIAVKHATIIDVSISSENIVTIVKDTFTIYQHTFYPIDNTWLVAFKHLYKGRSCIRSTNI